MHDYNTSKEWVDKLNEIWAKENKFEKLKNKNEIKKMLWIKYEDNKVKRTLFFIMNSLTGEKRDDVWFNLMIIQCSKRTIKKDIVAYISISYTFYVIKSINALLINCDTRTSIK